MDANPFHARVLVNEEIRCHVLMTKGSRTLFHALNVTL